MAAKKTGAAKKTDPWINDVEKSISDFAKKHKITYAKSERELSASFEIGCLHSLTDFYENNFKLTPANLKDGKFRYLTTPNGNPDNFSYITATGKTTQSQNESFEIRQQVRIKSHINTDIAFTPDIVVLRKDRTIESVQDKDYASGKRKFFFVECKDVIAAHECKSTNPFPELLISFIGMLYASHNWLSTPTDISKLATNGLHLAPALFVGGTASGLHVRMVKAMESTMPMNVILGIHRGTWNLLDPSIKRNRINS